MKPSFEYSVQIKEFHLDTFGHVNNAIYMALYEEARWDFITKHGYGLEKIQQEKKGPVILESTIRYRRELINREIIKIVSEPIDPEKSKIMTINQKMLKSDGSLASEAIFTVGFMDLRERKLIMAPEDWRKACGF
jgi:YbgC/YbaW family acyl-CoA thioester hydrolase